MFILVLLNDIIMKKLFIALLVFSSCGSDEDSREFRIEPHPIVGTWVLEIPEGYYKLVKCEFTLYMDVNELKIREAVAATPDRVMREAEVTETTEGLTIQIFDDEGAVTILRVNPKDGKLVAGAVGVIGPTQSWMDNMVFTRK